MKHWIVNYSAEAVPTWLQAFPSACLLGRHQLAVIQSDDEGVVWYRLRSGESVSAVLSGWQRGVRQTLVLLCDEPDEAVVMEALATGVAGCCNTHAAPEVLEQVSLVVSHGGLWIGQAMLQKVVGATTAALTKIGSAPDQQGNPLAGLSEREIQVANLVAEGASNKEIANQLAITERTVKAHLTTIFEKLAVRDRLQLSLRVNGLKV